MAPVKYLVQFCIKMHLCMERSDMHLQSAILFCCFRRCWHCFRQAPFPELRKRRRGMAAFEREKITKASIFQFFLGLVPFLFFILILIPVVWMALSSLKSTNEIFEDLWALPENWLFSNYAQAWNTGISSYFKNSLIVTVCTCLLNVAVCSLYAFSLVVFEFKGKRLFHLLAVGGLMFSPIVSLIPLYQELQALHLYNTRLALILIYTHFRCLFALC